MPENLRTLIDQNKQEMGSNPFAGRNRIAAIELALLEQKYNPEFLSDLGKFAVFAAKIAKEMCSKDKSGNLALPSSLEEKEDFLNKYKLQLNKLVGNTFKGVEIDKPVKLIKRIETNDFNEISAQHHPEDHKIYMTQGIFKKQSVEQALSWLVHETGHEIILSLRNNDPTYLYGEENSELEYYSNFISMCTDEQFNYGAYAEAYDYDVEETTVRCVQALFAHEVCASAIRAEKISSMVLTNERSTTAEIFREKHPVLTRESTGFRNWLSLQFVRA